MNCPPLIYTLHSSSIVRQHDFATQDLANTAWAFAKLLILGSGLADQTVSAGTA